jgi:hypothetical protein
VCFGSQGCGGARALVGAQGIERQGRARRRGQGWDIGDHGAEVDHGDEVGRGVKVGDGTPGTVVRQLGVGGRGVAAQQCGCGAERPGVRLWGRALALWVADTRTPFVGHRLVICFYVLESFGFGSRCKAPVGNSLTSIMLSDRTTFNKKISDSTAYYSI